MLLLRRRVGNWSERLQQHDCEQCSVWSQLVTWWWLDIVAWIVRRFAGTSYVCAYVIYGHKGKTIKFVEFSIFRIFFRFIKFCNGAVTSNVQLQSYIFIIYYLIYLILYLIFAAHFANKNRIIDLLSNTTWHTNIEIGNTINTNTNTHTLTHKQKSLIY